MTKIFSEDALKASPSQIREILKVINQPGIISLAGGLPNPDTFVGKEEIIYSIKQYYNNFWLQYAKTSGVDELKEKIANEWKVNKEEVMIVSGSQQGLYLSSLAFIDKDDKIITEKPTYLAALQAFRTRNPNIIGVDIENDGINIESLEKILENEKIKFIYTIPNFQNPSGITMSLNKRKELIKLAKDYEFLIIEDDPYGKLRYSGEDIPSLKKLDDENNVLYLGTFSKIFAPGTRIGFIIGDSEILKKFEILKQPIDLCTETLGQYLISSHFDKIPKNIDYAKKIYKKKRDLMLDSLDIFMPDGVKWIKPDGGMFLWIKTNVNTDKMFDYAIKNGVAYVPGKTFYPNEDNTNYLRLNFTYPEDDKIEEGIIRLSKTIKEFK